MQKRFKTLFFIFSLSWSFTLPGQSLAYEPTSTHAGLTEQIVEFYNLSFPEKKITKQ